MSVFTYNNVILPFPLHTNFNQHAIYDPSNTDFIATGFDIQLSCLINTDYGNMLLTGAGGSGGGNPADLINKVRKKLLTPRQKLSVTVNGIELIPSKPANNNGDVDAMNGPQPQYCKVVRMTNTTFFMSYAIKAAYWEYDKDSKGNATTSTSALLYNRWSQSVELDECQFTRLSRRGTFQLRSDNSDGKAANDYLKTAAWLGVPLGFLRKRSSFTVSEDGLKVSYDVEDQEQFKQPPSPAFKAEGSYSETVRDFLSRRFATVHLQLWGDKETKQSDLIATAINVASAKLTSAGKVVIPSSWKITVDMYKNTVIVELGGMFMSAKPKSVAKTPKQIEAGIAARLAGMQWTKLDKTPVSDDNPEYIPNYKLMGTADQDIEAAGYHSPDKDDSIDQNTWRFGDGKLVGKEGKEGQ